MAAGRLPLPGTEFGPCTNECNHIDCRQTRDMAEAICLYCETSIGYGTRFYMLEDKSLVHANCHEDELEAIQRHETARDEDRDDFRDPGGRSALRTGELKHPCPTCQRPNMLTDKDIALGYQCDFCANKAEAGY